MNCVELNRAEFEAFTHNNEYADFHQSLKMYDHLLTMGSESYLVGIKSGDTVLAAALITALGTKKGRKTFTAPKGFVIDYGNAPLVASFTNALQEFCKQQGAFRLIIEPCVSVVERDIDGEIVEGGYDNRSFNDTLLQAGFDPIDIGSQTKWIFCLNLKDTTKEEVWKHFKQTTRNSISRTLKKYQLEIRTLSRDQLGEFKELTANTAERRQFDDKTLAYYESMYDSFGDDVVFKMVELNCDRYLQSLEHEVQACQQKLDKLSSSPSNDNKREHFTAELKKNTLEIEEIERLKKEHGVVITLSGAMFILFGSEVVYLFSGSYDQYKKYFGPYALQWDMISYAIDNGYTRYNFFGIEDVFDKQGNGHGVYTFKKGFDGTVVEMMDAYEIGCSPYYTVYRAARKLKSSVKTATP